MLRSILLICIFLVFATGTYAQYQQLNTAQKFDPEKLKRDELALQDREGKKFMQPGPWTCVDGTTIDISKEQKPTVIFVGFASCVPCHLLMAALSEVIQEKSYRNYTFIYLTFDNKETIGEEIDPQTQKRLRIVQVNRQYIAQNNLALGYPTVFFLSADNTVKTIQRGGLTENKNAVKHWWRQHLDKVK